MSVAEIVLIVLAVSQASEADLASKLKASNDALAALLPKPAA